ncbi:MAG: MFS transporter, partial [Pseudomonadota bacterium]
MPATNRHHTNMRSALIMLIFGFLALAIAFGVRSSFGLYIGPLHEQVGFSIATLSIVFAVQNLMWGIAQPIAGAWADTKGATPVMV